MKNKTIKMQTDELNKIIEWFDSENFELEQAMEKYEQASKLADEIEVKLAELKNKVTVISKKFDFSK